MHIFKPPTLNIKNLKISPPLALAPMVGLSHSALRSVVREIGGVGLLYTEMLSAKRLPGENERVSPYLVRSDIEDPLFYQIFLNDTRYIDAAVEKLHRLGAHGIDINLGCPAPQLRKIGAGAKLADNSENVARIFRNLRKKTHLPLTAKIRLGKGRNISKFLDFCKMIEAEGADCLTIHARLNDEKFCRKPRWEWVGKAKDVLSIPIIANGGIFSAEDAQKCLSQSNADGLMIGRAAAMKPWVFSEICSQVYGIESKRVQFDSTSIYMRFVACLQTNFREERRLGRLKKFTHYFARIYQYGHHLASGVQTSKTLDQAVKRAEIFFAKNESIRV